MPGLSSFILAYGIVIDIDDIRIAFYGFHHLYLAGIIMGNAREVGVDLLAGKTVFVGFLRDRDNFDRGKAVSGKALFPSFPDHAELAGTQ